MIGILAAYTITSGDTNPRILIVWAVDVHVKNILLCLVIVNDLGSFNNPVGAEVPCFASAREECTSVCPFDEIGGGVAVDVLEVCSVCLVLANHVVGSINLTCKGQMFVHNDRM